MLELHGIAKSFPGVRALDDVSFSVAAGEIHALVGENGAGKSTLIKILGGVLRPDAGSVFHAGEEVRLASAHHAQRLGVSVIYQELNLMPDLTVAENVLLGREPRRGPLLDWKALARAAAAILARLDVRVDPMALVEDLSVAEQQMVEIAKALSFDARLIVMDEPTAALSDREVERLFEVTRALRDRGTTVLFVSHRLKEVFALADRVTVLRDGRFVGTRPVEGTDQGEVVRMMVGRDVPAAPAREAAAGGVVLSVRGATAAGAFEDVSFDVRAGEVVGVAGLMGSGRTELAEALYGLRPLDAGEVLVGGRPAARAGPRGAIAAGMGFLTEDRKAAGIFPCMSVKHNLTMTILGRLARWRGLLIDRDAERAAVEDRVAKLDIRCRDADQEIELLSGGNQQKVLLGRALASDARALVLCEPTRGVDVGAKAEIHGLVADLARRGAAVVVASSDLSDIIGLSDACVVMHAGRAAGRLERGEMTETAIMALATGHRAAVGAEAL